MAKGAKMNGPAATFRLGNAKATIWDNDGFYSVTLVKVYKDGEEYKETNSFNPGDLQSAREVTQKACDWIMAK
jgi:hypothetical protein